MTKQIVVLASGNGSNFESIIRAIDAKFINAEIRCLIVDRNCGAEKIAEKHGISYYKLGRKNDAILNLHVLAMLCHMVDLIVCAGYLSILSSDFVALFPNKIINLHPSLLPLHGGRGMYGRRVHQAVIDANETESGCTVHLVDNGVDTGLILAQEIVPVSALDTPESLQEKIQIKERQLLPNVIKILLEK